MSHRAYICAYVSEARAWVHVDACLPACPRAPAAIVARNEGLAFARWQLSRGEFAIKRDDIIYRRTSYSREKEVADIGLSRGKGTDGGMGGTSRRGAGPLRALIY